MPRVVIDSVSDDMKILGGSKGFGQSFHKEGPAPFKVGPVVIDYSVGYPTDHKYNRNQNLDGRKKCSSPRLEDDDCSPIATTTTSPTTPTTTTTRTRVPPRSQTAQLRHAILNKNVYFLQTLISRSDSAVNPEADFSEQEEEEGEEGETDGDVADDDNGGAFCASKPLHLAAQRGFADGVKVLFLAGANPDSADAFGLTPLHYAIMSGSAETVRLLSQLGSNLNAGDNDGDTPLHYAVRESNSDIVKLLIDFGVNPKIENCDGETPYTLACELNETKISIQLADSVRRTSGSFRWAGHSAAPASFTFV